MLNLTGKQFGKWTVLEKDLNYKKEHNIKSYGSYWKCKCECGTIKAVSGINLTSGRSLSCGCSKKTLDRNIIGERFGNLVVLEEDNTKTHITDSKSVFLCRCDCGNLTYVRLKHLHSGEIKTCGCSTKKDLQGQKFGKLLVLKDSGLRSNRGTIMWECQCECGSITNVRSSHLLSQQIYSCGCINSKGEDKIAKILKENNVPFEKQKAFNTCLNPKTKHSLYFDFYINNSFLLEFDGEQHYYWNDNGWNTRENYNQVKERDSYKNQWCKENKIILKRIPYWRLENLTIEDILSDEFEVINND